MNIINGDWRTAYLQATSLIIIDTLVLTLFIGPIVRKDGMGKIVTLALGFSLITVLSFWNVYLVPEVKKRQVIKECTVFVLLTTHLYVLAIGTFSGILSVWSRFASDFSKERIQNYRNQYIIILTIIFSIFMAIYTCYCYDVISIIHSPYFGSCLAIVAFSVLFLYVVSRPLNHFDIAEAVRRKIFHIGPILVIPIVSHLNNDLLVLILSGGFQVLLWLQVIRYMEQELDEEHADVIASLKALLRYFNVVFNWMASFNKREKHFWFTHIFLTLSLLCSYQLPHVITIKLKLSPHLVLVIIAADAFAALIGTKWGRVKIFKGKTLEGTAAFILTCFLGSYMLIPLNVTQLIILSTVCGLGELLGGDADNIITILAYYLVRFVFVLIVRLKLV